MIGDKLADVLLRNDGVSMFSNVTKEQYALSKELWNLLKEEISDPSVDDIFQLADYSLDREIQWIQNSKERLAEIRYSSNAKFDSMAKQLAE